jgi:transposase InsO family protein
VEIAGIASTANGLWMGQIGRRVTDVVDGILVGKRYLIHDRDPLFTAEFLNLLAGIGVESVKLPPRSPNLNAYAERFVRTIKESCLDRLILFGEGPVAKGSFRVRGALPYGTSAPRPEQSTDSSRTRPRQKHRQDLAAPTLRRSVVLLLSCRSLSW